MFFMCFVQYTCNTWKTWFSCFSHVFHMFSICLPCVVYTNILGKNIWKTSIKTHVYEKIYLTYLSKWEARFVQLFFIRLSNNVEFVVYDSWNNFSSWTWTTPDKNRLKHQMFTFCAIYSTIDFFTTYWSAVKLISRLQATAGTCNTPLMSNKSLFLFTILFVLSV